MPFREMNPNLGFRAETAPAVEPTSAPSWTMQQWADTISLLAAPTNPLAAMQAYERQSAGIQGGFRLENDVLAAVDLFTRPAYDFDPEFDAPKAIKEAGLWDDYRDNFIGVRNQQEFDDIAGRIAQENRDKEAVAAAGPVGILALIAAGVVSPTVALPFIGEARGLAAVGKGLGWGFAGGLAQELPLQMAQETRSLSDSAWSVGMSTVLSGVLGGAAGYLHKPLEEIADDVAGGMGIKPGSTAIPSPASVGAAARDTDVGVLKGALGFEKVVGDKGPVGRFLGSPVVQNLTQRTSKQAAWMMALLSDAGLVMERNAEGFAHAPGGTAENRIQKYYGQLATSIDFTNDAFARYRLNKNSVGRMDRAVAAVSGVRSTGEKLSRSEFNQQVSIAMRNGDVHEIPEVAEVAKHIRKNLLDPILQRAMDLGFFKRLTSAGNAESGAEPQGMSVGNLESDLPEMEGFTTVGQALDLVERVGENAGYKTLARLLRPFVENINFRIINDLEDEVLGTSPKVREIFSTGNTAAIYNPGGRYGTEGVFIKGKSFLGGRALTQTTVLHETLHAATAHQLAKGRLDAQRGIPSPEARAYKRIDKLRTTIQTKLDTGALGDFLKANPGIRDIHTNYALTSVDEFVAIGLTDPNFQKLLQNIVVDESKGKSLWYEFVDAIKKALFGTNEIDDTAFEQLLEATSDVIASSRKGPNGRTLAQVEEGASAVKVVGDISYLMRDYNYEAIVRRRQEFEQIISDHFQQLNTQDYRRALEKHLAKERSEEADLKFARQWEDAGAKHVDFTPNVDFAARARELARAVTEAILKTNSRLPTVDIIHGERGPQLARMLSISSNKLRTADGVSFLNDNLDEVLSKYVRTMAADIEITRALGALDPESGLNEAFLKLNDEFHAQSQALPAELERKLGREPTKEELEKANKKLEDEYALYRRNLEAVVGRLRGTWGVPKDPAGFAARAARTVMQLNVLRFMGGVTISSLPDIGRPVMKYGLERTFRDGWLPFVANLKSIPMTRRELQLAGVATDVSLHTRANQISNIGDYMVRGSKFEKGVDWASSKMGLMALFDYWTTFMKQISGATAIAQVLDDVRLVNEGTAAGFNNLKKAQERLAASGIDPTIAQEIWREVQRTGGGDRIDGVWWPNTEAWKNQNAIDAFRAAISGHVNQVIVTPGVERPLWTDATLPARMITQFKSFAFASTTKTMMAGLQQRDMAAVTGAMISLATGALSFYIYARLAGGRTEQEMLEASPGRWADEAINRSGLFANMQLVQDMLAEVPALAPYVTLGGQRTSRRGGQGVVDAALGPSFDALSEAAQVIGDVKFGEPYQGLTQGDVNRAVNLLPLQNHFLLRQAFDRIGAASGFPERRQ